MKLLTGNDLASGDVIWWTGAAWSRHVEQARDVGTDGEAIAVEEERARRVTGPYVIDATPTPAGPRPAHIKDRIRALGPTVRPDLTLKPGDPAAVEAVVSSCAVTPSNAGVSFHLARACGTRSQRSLG